MKTEEWTIQRLRQHLTQYTEQKQTKQQQKKTQKTKKMRKRNPPPKTGCWT